MPYCSRCGHKLDEGDRYCSQCGKKAEEEFEEAEKEEEAKEGEEPKKLDSMEFDD